MLEPWTRTINSFWGVWAIAADADSLAIGGEFTTFSGVNVQGVALLGPNGTPVTTTTSSTTSTSTSTSTSTIDVDDDHHDHAAARAGRTACSRPTRT